MKLKFTFFLQAVLQRKKENVEGLLEYARIVHKKGEIQAKEAMAICVCLMTPKQSKNGGALFGVTINVAGVLCRRQTVSCIYDGSGGTPWS